MYSAHCGEDMKQGKRLCIDSGYINWYNSLPTKVDIYIL